MRKPVFVLFLLLLAFQAARRDALGILFTPLDDPLAALPPPIPRRNGSGFGTVATGVDGSNIVGYYVDGTDIRQGFLYDGSSYTTLNGPLPHQGHGIFGDSGVTLTGISGSRSVGYTYFSFSRRSFLYDGSTFTTVSDPRAGNQYSTYVNGISGGWMIGAYNGSALGQFDIHGFISDGTNYIDINDPLAVYGSYASGMSGGIVAGAYYTDASLKPHGFLFDGTSFTTLDDPIGVDGTRINGISGNHLVGDYYDSLNGRHSFFYNGSTFITIEDPFSTSGPLGESATHVLGVSGETIVGYYVDSNGNNRGFMAQVPEPSSILLLGIGAVTVLAALLGVRRTVVMRNP